MYVKICVFLKRLNETARIHLTVKRLAQKP